MTRTSAPPQVYIAETTTLQQVLLLGIKEGIQHLQIERDNLLVINAGIWDPPWQIAYIIKNIQSLPQQFISYNIINIKHIY